MMTRIRRNGRRAALPTAIAVVFAIAVAAFWGGQFAPPPPPAIAQGAPTNVTARNGATAGQVIVSWTPAFGSQANRVGWASEPDVIAASAAGNWLEAFNFVDLGAAKRTYTVKRLQPGVRHAFLVATSIGSGRYNYSDWIIITTTAAPTPTPCPTAAPGQNPTQPGFCPITGLPLDEDGYQAVNDTVTGTSGSYTLQAVTYPRSVQLIAGGDYFLPGEGRMYVRTCGTYRNTLDIRFFFSGGNSIMVDSDAGVGFFFPNNADGSVSDTYVNGGASKRLCQTWTLPATAQTIIIPVNLGLAQSDIHLYRVDR